METDSGNSKCNSEAEGSAIIQGETPARCLHPIAGSPRSKQLCASDNESDTESNISDTSSEPGPLDFHHCFEEEEEEDWVGNCELPPKMTAFNQEVEDWDAELEQSEDNYYDREDLADLASAHSFSVPDSEWQEDTSYNPSVHHASVIAWTLVSRQLTEGQFDDADPKQQKHS
ncbi:hypothetical protein XENTR_v10009752 [Xenopus tropicalis]|uniref:Coordinator of PRMT5 and differentiation stimulator isoform X2 n=1 Tax=Xenopus tropicalis TaxID=8364 RepID=A0A8J0QME5_XENTR|nr:coordinator of PRMT5 and differentiation stimulator isoform X2 [Xenopus tropicalis]KAE8619393.1 hypothetical protein XENTR_v10009752 [Xenopus tropicalis]|eukprot:XP_002932758.2 PREDICTED: coordinator of PRMT5 and differentiation stimulator isoform X2 [Xenopus tropicalis]